MKGNADAAEAVDTEDDASAVVLEPVAQGEKFVEPAENFLL